MDGVALNGVALETKNGSDSEQAASNLPLSVTGNEVSSFPESNVSQETRLNNCNTSSRLLPVYSQC
jgi:hypothetical protein